MVTMDLSTWHGLRTRDPRRLTLGSAQWGMPYGIANRRGQPDPDEVGAILGEARAAGLHTIDTARAYGESERLIGALAPSAEGWRIVTKLAPDVHREGLGLGEVLERVASSLEESRRALQRDALPLLLLHRFAHRHACGGRLWRMLLAERDAGRIGALGVSAGTPEEAWAALEDPDIEALQVATSLLDLRLHRQGFFARARELGRTIYVRSVFLQGLAHLPPQELPTSLSALSGPMETIRRSARELGVPERALYLAFVRELPGVHPVVGCETRAQLVELIEDWSSETVDAATVIRLADGLPTHEAELVDPSRWAVGEAPTRRPAGSASATSTTSVATLPA